MSWNLLNFTPPGNNFEFIGPNGPITIDVMPRLNSNEAQLIFAAALHGRGIASVSDYMARPALERGSLLTLVPDFPLTQPWLKVLIPQGRSDISRVQALLEWLRRDTSDNGNELPLPDTRALQTR